MPLTLDDIPEIVKAGQDLIDSITTSISPSSPAGRTVTKQELLSIVEQAGSFVATVAREIRD